VPNKPVVINEDSDITLLKGVSTVRAAALNSLGIYTVGNLIELYPRRYENRFVVKNIIDLIPEDEVTIRAVVVSSPSFRLIRSNLSVTTVKVADETGKLDLIFYNQKYVAANLKKNTKYCFYGKISRGAKSFNMISPSFVSFDKRLDFERLLPVYPLTKGITHGMLRSLIKNSLVCMDNFTENLPSSIVSKYALCSREYAIKNIHFPESFEKTLVARRRLVFEEFLSIQVMLSHIRDEYTKNSKGISFPPCDDVDILISQLPFELSSAQKKVWEEINLDMESSRVMNRLVLGDVGSGKTIIAVLAMLKAIRGGYQAIFMAPTEILAEQHFNNISRFFEPFNINVALLTGSCSASKKRKLLIDIESGVVACVIGTHALISHNVVYKNPGIVITDEQHRFGVRQREKLSSQGANCDILVMTATPIPRTLALVLYNDLDISIIDILPKGRLPIQTFVVEENMRKRIYDWAVKLINEGRQVYIVHPLIEDNESLDLLSAEQNYKSLSETVFKDVTVALIHGKMSSKDKDSIMHRFSDGEIKVLFSTTVIEVGVDVPNACLMIIENAERFGLAGLHQLRGRVGRSSLQSYCVLFSHGNNELVKQRMNIMKSSNDGFLISEKDLELRGPGDFFGTVQHGLPQFKIANLYEDTAILKEAQAAVSDLTSPDCDLYVNKVIKAIPNTLNL